MVDPYVVMLKDTKPRKKHEQGNQRLNTRGNRLHKVNSAKSLKINKWQINNNNSRVGGGPYL